MRSILVVNPKGGCGKTTIATNLATYYAVWDMSTALVDLDPQQSSMDKKVARLIKLVDVVIIPVMPSAIDMRVAASFIADIVGKVRANNANAIMGVVANRVQKNYHSYGALISFLRKLDIPLVGALRNSQNYVKAADSGIGIFEASMSDVKIDMKEWEPIIHWVEGKRVLK